MSFDQTYTKLATTLSDEALCAEYRCTERCALLATRSRRDLALLRLRCLCRELERRHIPGYTGAAAPAREPAPNQAAS